MTEDKYQRVFLALWPEREVRRQLVQCQTGLNISEGRKVSADNLHVTLHFMGSLSVTLVNKLTVACQQVSVEPHQLELDTVGGFKRAQIVWLGSSECPQALLNLHRQLGKLLQAFDIETDDRVFTPHVSLFRKVRRLPETQQVNPVLWSVNDFVLVESETLESGPRYRVLHRFAGEG